MIQKSLLTIIKYFNSLIVVWHPINQPLLSRNNPKSPNETTPSFRRLKLHPRPTHFIIMFHPPISSLPFWKILFPSSPNNSRPGLAVARKNTKILNITILEIHHRGSLTSIPKKCQLGIQCRIPRKRHIIRLSFVRFFQKYFPTLFRVNAKKAIIVVTPMAKNSWDCCQT